MRSYEGEWEPSYPVVRGQETIPDGVRPPRHENYPARTGRSWQGDYGYPQRSQIPTRGYRDNNSHPRRPEPWEGQAVRRPKPPRDESKGVSWPAKFFWLATGGGLFLDGLAVHEAYREPSVALNIFWLSIAIPFAAYVLILMRGNISRRLRHLIIAFVGLYPSAVYHLSSPLVLGGFDEHLHERTLSDLLHGSGLFAANPMLAVSPYYPGLELFTGTLVRLTGIPAMLGMILVVLLCRLLLVLAIYALSITFLRSERGASLAVLFYAMSPQFYFFNSQFAYQTMAITLGLGGIYLLRRAEFKQGAAARRLTRLSMVALVGTVVSHHLTSWLVLGFLIVWAMVARPGNRKAIAKAAAVMASAIAIWSAAISHLLAGYLGPVFVAALNELGAEAQGTSQRQMFADSAGAATPEWERYLLIFYALACTCLAIISGTKLLVRAFRSRERAIGVLALLTLAYPLTLAAHFVPAASDIGDRATTFLFLPLALSCAMVAGTFRKPKWFLKRSPRVAAVTSLLIVPSLVYVGGVVLGAGPGWGILPGPYLVSAEARTQDPQTLAAVRWAATHIPQGSRVVADRIPADLLEAQARLFPVIQPVGDLAPAWLYFSPDWGAQETAIVKKLDINYIYVDQRLDESLPHVGFYFIEGETNGPTRITAGELTKFANVRGLEAVFHQGTVTIYSTTGLGVVPAHDGFTGSRPMGLGEIGDFTLGAVLTVLAVAFRRKLRWALSIIRDAGFIGTALTVMSLIILLGGILFELRLMPGPWFAVGSFLAGAVYFTVLNARSGNRMRFRLRTNWLNPLVMLGVLAAMVGIALSVRSAWVIDVRDVNNLLSAYAASVKR